MNRQSPLDSHGRMAAQVFDQGDRSPAAAAIQGEINGEGHAPRKNRERDQPRDRLSQDPVRANEVGLIEKFNRQGIGFTVCFSLMGTRGCVLDQNGISTNFASSSQQARTHVVQKLA